MENTQTTEFRIFRNGEIDRAFELRKRGRRALSLFGQIAKSGMLTTVNILDEWVKSGQ